jgi:hypothetical protein
VRNLVFADYYRSVIYPKNQKIVTGVFKKILLNGKVETGVGGIGREAEHC